MNGYEEHLEQFATEGLSNLNSAACLDIQEEILSCCSRWVQFFLSSMFLQLRMMVDVSFSFLEEEWRILCLVLAFMWSRIKG
jgi:hypothetical protein